MSGLKPGPISEAKATATAKTEADPPPTAKDDNPKQATAEAYLGAKALRGMCL